MTSLSPGFAGPDNLRVFVNCPFDRRYKPMLDAAIFCIHDLGFQARHALIDNASVLRLPRITEEILQARYSIHDLSRVGLSGALRMPRFNMPFEAGIAYAAHTLATRPQAHHLLLLDARPWRYQAFLSDAAGLDASAHGNDPAELVKLIRRFLRAKSGRQDMPDARRVLKRYDAFRAELRKRATLERFRTNLQDLKQLDYINDLQQIMAQWIAENVS